MTFSDELYAKIRRENQEREARKNDPELIRQGKEREADYTAKLEFVKTLIRLGVHDQFSASIQGITGEQAQKARMDFWNAYCYVVQLPIA